MPSLLERCVSIEVAIEDISTSSPADGDGVRVRATHSLSAVEQ